LWVDDAELELSDLLSCGLVVVVFALVVEVVVLVLVVLVLVLEELVVEFVPDICLHTFQLTFHISSSVSSNLV
jgi:hypothetical protein